MFLRFKVNKLSDLQFLVVGSAASDQKVGGSIPDEAETTLLSHFQMVLCPPYRLQS